MPGCRRGPRLSLLFGVCVVLFSVAVTTINKTTEALANFYFHSSQQPRSPRNFFLHSPLQEQGERKRTSRSNKRGCCWPGMQSTSSLGASDQGEDGSSSMDAPTEDDILVEEDLDEYCEVEDDSGCSAFEKLSEGQWIRLENQTSKGLADISGKEDVIRRIGEVKEVQAKSGRSDLYSRQWKYRKADEEDNSQAKPASNCDDSNEQLPFDEPVNAACPHSTDEDSFTVLQFNMLAEGLSAGPCATIPFQNNADNPYGLSKKQTYGGFTEIPHPKTTMDFALRRWRLLEVILGSDGSAPFDLIALEEIDRFRGFFAPVLRLFGYKGIFVPKSRSPCVDMGWYSDGCAIFWKMNLFELLSERRIEYKMGSQNAIIAALRHRPTARSLLVAVTHLKAKNFATNENIRVAQVNELLSLLEHEAEALARRERIENNIPILVLGDFNADPPSQSVSEGDSEVSAIKQVLNFRTSDLPSEETTTMSRTSFQSAYPIDHSSYTTWKSRGKTTSKRIIDYIFYSDTRLECQATLGIPNEEELEPTKLPGLRYPSDHIAIAAIMKLLKNE